MKIIADENMPLLQERFDTYGQLSAVPGRHITAELVADCDVLLVRSVTQVNRELLADSNVRFVGSATSGIDHIDTDYLQAQGITFAHAPGCNADAVVQYMFAVLCARVPNWRQQTTGIVGCGQVGGRLYRALSALGVNCRVYDPYLDKHIPDMTSLEQVLAADIVCLHTPLTQSGAHPTRHMIDAAALSAMKPGACLINASRGAVVDNRALSDYFSSPHIEREKLNVVLDVWEHEPNIDTSLLDKLALASPHIAGYSIDGRRRGTDMVFEAFHQWLIQNDTQKSPGRSTNGEAQTPLEIPGGTLEDYILATFDVVAESSRMRAALTAASVQGEAEVGRAFDQLRKTCPARREFSHYQITGVVDSGLAGDLGTLGFDVSQL